MPIAIKHPRRVTQKKKSKLAAAIADGTQAWRKRYGVSQMLLARLLDVSVRTVSGIDSGTITQMKVQRNKTQIARLFETLEEAMNAGYIGTWIEQPNEMLDGLKPVEAIERGKIDLVWQVAEGLREGSPL
jgi:DNA-binding XRE family transcriptional regulator